MHLLRNFLGVPATRARSVVDLTKSERLVKLDKSHRCSKLFEPMLDPQTLFGAKEAFDPATTLIGWNERTRLKRERDAAPVQIGDNQLEFLIGRILVPGKVGDPSTIQSKDMDAFGGVLPRRS